MAVSLSKWHFIGTGLKRKCRWWTLTLTEQNMMEEQAAEQFKIQSGSTFAMITSPSSCLQGDLQILVETLFMMQWRRLWLVKAWQTQMNIFRKAVWSTMTKQHCVLLPIRHTAPGMLTTEKFYSFFTHLLTFRRLMRAQHNSRRGRKLRPFM